ncbi:MAG TPA: hypothetical protein VMH05_25675 [Bryobacteraceae bacterium]|nr:hypothetical protein [Bryobacteraceae bacterium]
MTCPRKWFMLGHPMKRIKKISVTVTRRRVTRIETAVAPDPKSGGPEQSKPAPASALVPARPKPP